MPSISGFGKGLCACGNFLWQKAVEKYKFAVIVKTGRDTIAWQWPCRKCGAIHHEPCTVVVHGGELEVTSVGADD